MRASRSVSLRLCLSGLGLALGASACTGSPSPLAPRSDGASSIAELGWVMIGLATIVCIVVFAAMLIGLRTQPSTDEMALQRADSGRREPRADHVVVIAGMVIPAVILTLTFGYTVYTLRETAGVAGATLPMHGEHGDLSPAGASGSNLIIQITGHQWWWEVDYPNAGVTTANEVHVPAGVPIQLTVTSQDVIHSFWIPQIAGKVDVIPGKVNTLRLTAPELGVYRGLCSEFCGLQHARMHLRLLVQPAGDFVAWLEAQQRPPTEPVEASASEGRRTFVARCGECHTVRGVSNGKLGPDLTHLANRATLGAGIHENDRTHLLGWTTDAQAMKPGNKMPSIPMSDSELRGLLDYLEGLR